MARALLTNNASTTLASGINNSVTSLSVATGTGALFPAISGSGYFYATLKEGSAVEIVKVTARTTDSFGTIVRAQEGTTAQSFTTAATVKLNLTAGVMAELAALGDAQTFSGGQRGAYSQFTDGATITLDLALANQFYGTLGGNRTLGAPTNAVAGQQGEIDIWQDTTGSRTLACAWMYSWAGGTAGVLSTTGGFCDLLAYTVKYYSSGTFTVTIATPGVFTKTAHGYITGMKCQLSTTGALPTGLAATTTYYIHVIDANTFHLSTTKANAVAGTYIATSGSQSGTHTIECGSIGLSLTKDIA